MAHFIKRADAATGDIRHRQLRRKLEVQADALVALLNSVFATHPYNKYCHIYRTLIFDHSLSPDEAGEYIKRLMHNAEIYAFRSP